MKAKLMKLLMHCHIFYSKEPVFFELLYTEFLSARRTLSFRRCAPEEDVRVQDQLDGWGAVKAVMDHQSLPSVPEIIRIELTSRFGIKKTQELIDKTEITWVRLPMSTD